MDPYKIDPHKYQGPLEDLEKKSGGNYSGRTAMIVAVLILLTGAGILFFIYGFAEFEGNESVESFAPLIPIWFAVFIPIIAIGKKNKRAATANQKKIIAFMVLGFSIVAISMIIFFVSVTQ